MPTYLSTTLSPENNDEIQMQKHRILIIRLSSIGDILLTTPFIRQVYRKFSNAQIDFIIKEEFKDLLHENPYVHNLIALQTNAKIKDLSKIKDKLRRVEYDYIFDLNNNIWHHLANNRLDGTIHKF